MYSPIIFSHLSFSWPDAAQVLDDLSVVFNTGRTGIIGPNGSGKTTILRLIAGQLKPTLGSVTVDGDVAWLPQTIVTHPAATVADLLGVADKLNALTAIEHGSTQPDLYDVIGDDWDIETRADEVLRQLDLASGALDKTALFRQVSGLSGGEAMAVAIAGCRLRRAAITLLDEPTNNLDEVLKASVIDMIATWPGTVVVASHDIDLLERVDTIAEMRDARLLMFGGGYSAWRAMDETEQAAAEQAERAAEQTLRVAKRHKVAVQERTARNLARGKKKAIKEGLDKMMRDAARKKAEDSAGRSRGVASDRVEEAATALTEATSRVRAVEHIVIDLPDPGVHESKRILELSWPDGQFTMAGPARVALTGRNGAGKTTLIERLLGLRPWPRTGHDLNGSAGHGGSAGPGHGLDGSRDSGHGEGGEGAPSSEYGPLGHVTGRLLTDRVGYLPQRMDILDDDADAVHNIMVGAPQASVAQIRAGLARLLLRGEDVFRLVGSLSGGERLRVSLGRLLFAEPPAQLLILDEPTNNLDLMSVDQLVEALSGYRGALLVASHDQSFLSKIGVSTTVELVDTGARVTQLAS